MAIFVVLSQGDPAPLSTSIRASFPEQHFEFEAGKWFISADGMTSQDVSRKIGLGEEPSAVAGVVVRSEGYYGRARADLWEWLKAKTAPAVHA